MSPFHRQSLLCGGVLLISLAASAPGESTLREVRFYDHPPALRVVLDLDQLADVELSPELVAGRVTVRVPDCALSPDFRTSPQEFEGQVEIVDRGGASQPLTLRLNAGHPLASTDQFALRQVGDVVLTLQRDTPVLPPATVPPASDEAPAAAVPAPPPPVDSVSPVVESTSQPAAESIALNLPSVGVAPIVERIEAPDAPEIEGEAASASPSSPELTLGAANPAALGPDAPADDYAATPGELEDAVPSAVAPAFREAVSHHDRAGAVDAINEYMSEHPNDPSAEAMVFLVGEQRHWAAREAQRARRSADWLQPIDDFRYALRLFPDSRWAPMAWLRIADAQQQMGLNEEALATLESFERAGTDYSVAKIILMRADLLAALELTDDEIEALNQLVARDPTSPQVARAEARLGHLYHSAGDGSLAHEAYRRAWDLDQTLLLQNPDHLSEAAEAAMDANDYDWAQTLIDHLLSDYPTRSGNARVLGFLARLRRAQGNTAEAYRIYQTMLNQYGETPDTLEAVIHLAMQGEEDTASGHASFEIADQAYINPRTAYEDVIRRFPDAEVTQVAYQRLGRILLAQGETDHVLQVLNDLLVGHPDTPLRPNAEMMMSQALDRSLQRLLDAGDAMGAVRMHCESQGMAATFRLNPTIQWGLAQSYVQLGLWEQASALTERMLDLWGGRNEPALPWDEVLSSHIVALRHGQRMDEALASIDRWLENFPQSPRRAELAFARAGVLHGLGRNDECLRAIDDAMALGGTPDQRLEAVFLRGDCTRRTLGPDMAIPVYVEALETFQREGRDHLTAAVPFEIVFGLADCLYQTGNWSRARRVYQELLEVYPQASERPVFEYRLAQCLAHTGQPDEARQQLDALVQANASSVWEQIGRQAGTDLDWAQRYPQLFVAGGATP